MERDEQLQHINPNPSQEAYLKEQDISVRKFCLGKVIEAIQTDKITFAGTLTEFAQDLYDWVMNNETDKTPA